MPQNELCTMYAITNHNNIRAFLFIKDKLVRVDTFLKKKLKASNTWIQLLRHEIYIFIFFFHFDAFIFMQTNFTLYVQSIKKGGFQLRTTFTVLLFSSDWIRSCTVYHCTENSTQGNFYFIRYDFNLSKFICLGPNDIFLKPCLSENQHALSLKLLKLNSSRIPRNFYSTEMSLFYCQKKCCKF